MVELGLEDITYTQGLAMGARMEAAVTPARLQMIGHTVLEATKTAARAIVGDGIGMIAAVDPGTAAFFMHLKNQQPNQEPPAQEA